MSSIIRPHLAPDPVSNELSIDELDVIIDALNWKKRAIDDQQVTTEAGGHTEPYDVKVERRTAVEEIIRKVKVLKREMKSM
jgi:hypothetical protein